MCGKRQVGSKDAVLHERDAASFDPGATVHQDERGLAVGTVAPDDPRVVRVPDDAELRLRPRLSPGDPLGPVAGGLEEPGSRVGRADDPVARRGIPEDVEGAVRLEDLGDTVSLTDKILKIFDAEMLRDPRPDQRHAALTALHFWGGLPSTEHTPGPWHWAKMDASTTMLLGDGQDPCCTSILIADGCKACADKGRNCSINGNEFDLSLIAAAPDLLAALKALVEALDAMEAGGPGVVIDQEVKQARCAISKAEGQS